MRLRVWTIPLCLAPLACRAGPEGGGADSGGRPAAPRACDHAIQETRGDVVQGIEVLPTGCGTLSLDRADVVPAGPDLEMYFDLPRRSFFPVVTPAEAATVHHVTWEGTFTLEGTGPLRYATWPRRLGDPVDHGVLGAAPVEAPAVLLGRDDGGWLLVAATSQREDEVRVAIAPPAGLRVTWGRDPRTLPAGRSVLYDPVTVVMGPDPATVIDRWIALVTEQVAPSPATGARGIVGPPADARAVEDLVEADPDGRFDAVVTDGRAPALRAAIAASGRRWIARGAPFLTATLVPGVLHRDGAPVQVDGRYVLDPTHADGFDAIRSRAASLVRAGADGAWLEAVDVATVEGDRAAADRSGLAAYRLGLEAFRAGFGDRPILAGSALPLASIGVVDALVPPDDLVPVVAALAPMTPGWFRIGPVGLPGDDLASELGVALMAGGSVHLERLPSDPTSRDWLLGEATTELWEAGGAASRAVPPWRREGPRFEGLSGLVIFTNGSSDPMIVEGPGGQRWLSDEVSEPGPRTLLPGHTEVWLPRRDRP